MILIYAMIFCTDVIRSFAFMLFPELAQVVFMPAPIEVTLRIIGAYLLALGIVGIYLRADSFNGFASAPVCRASHRVEDCKQIVWAL